MEVIERLWKIDFFKIRANFKYAAKGRFYRTFLVREDINLGELGELIVDIFGGTLEHFFLYRLKDKSLLPSSWVDEWNYMGNRINETLKDKTIKDLPEHFVFEYDTDEQEHFNWVRQHLNLIKEIGYENYLIEMLG